MDLLGEYDEEDEGSEEQASPPAAGQDGDAAAGDAKPGAEPGALADAAAGAGLSVLQLERLRSGLSAAASDVGGPSDASSPASQHGEVPEDSAPARQPPASAGGGPELPPAPPGPVNESVMEGVAKLLAERKKGTNVNEQLRDKKEFHNPGILERLVKEFKIIESGTNYAPDLFSPVYDSDMYFDSLLRQAERRDALARATRTSISFDSGGVQQPEYPSRGSAPHVAAPSAVSAAAAAAALAKAHGMAVSATQPAAQTVPSAASDGPVKKKSKWDTATKATSSSAGVPLPPVGVMPGGLRPGVLQQQQQLMMQQQLLQQQQQLLQQQQQQQHNLASKR